MPKNTATDEHMVMLEERKVKALEKIANVLDALTLWFEDIDKEESHDTIDIPVQQQEFIFTYVNSEDC